MSLLLASARNAAPSPLYRAIWRWHFYAGLYVIPFLIMLAATGLIMLWFTAIAPEFGDWLKVKPQAQPLGITAQADAALMAYPGGKIGQYIAPIAADNPALFRIDTADGARMLAVNPYDGTILRDTSATDTWEEFATTIHGTLFVGEDGGIGDVMIETAAGLGIVLVLTGLYMWWPRNGAKWREKLWPQFGASGRAFWKSLHASTGFWLSLVLVFFFVSGLTWTSLWGAKFTQAWSTFPAEKWDNVPLSDATHASLNHGNTKDVPWALEQTPMPESQVPEPDPHAAHRSQGEDNSAMDHSGHAGHNAIAGTPDGTPVNLESIVALGREIGFAGRFQIAAPADAKGVWTLSQDTMSYDSPDPTGDRTVHVDQYSGQILAEVAFKDYSLPGKAMAVGIALHEGQLGWWNVALNIIYCLGVILLCVGGIVMWWLRRPNGSFAAPPYPANYRLPVAIMVIALVVCVAFPLTGAAIIPFALIDLVLLRSRRTKPA